MKYLKAAIVTAITFLVVDLTWITLFVVPEYEAVLSGIMIEDPRIWPAVLFYLGYISGIVYFAVRPALAKNSVQTALLNGALLGAFAYGTYALTNHAVFEPWTTRLVISDIGWGTVLTGISATAGYLVARP